jgi:hypothetical protein
MGFASIEHYKKLCQTRSDLGFWAENIFDCEKLASSPQEQKHFYAYLTNPNGYDFETVEQTETLGDLEKRGELPECEPADERQIAEVYKNGNDYKIYVRNVVDDEKDDEKMPE